MRWSLWPDEEQQAIDAQHGITPERRFRANVQGLVGYGLLTPIIVLDVVLTSLRDAARDAWSN